MNPAAPVTKILILNSFRSDDYLWPLKRFEWQTVVESRSNAGEGAVATFSPKTSRRRSSSSL